MNIDAKSIQVERERALRDQFDADDNVRRAVREVRERTSGFGLLQRRRLLTDGVRLTRRMAPDVASSLDRARSALDFDEPVEIYVRPDPMFNAFCFRDPAGLLVIGLSSRIAEQFSPAELDFVIGHEIGHAYFDHFGIPMPQTAMVEDMAGPFVSKPMALNLYLWCRLAELSSDRIGLLCSRDPEAAVSSFFKLASGTSSTRIRPDLEAFASQAESLAAAPEARKEEIPQEEALGCFRTHPYSPFRVRALLAYSNSEPYLEATGAAPTMRVFSREQLRAIIERDVALMEPSYLEESTSQSRFMRDLLFDASVTVAAADGVICERELNVLQSLLGAERMFEIEGDLDAAKLAPIQARLAEAVARAVHEVPLVERTRLVQHLAVVSAADGETDESEMRVMIQIAVDLGVDPTFIYQTLAAASRPIGELGTVEAYVRRTASA